jgi:hypothetical protein
VDNRLAAPRPVETAHMVMDDEPIRTTAQLSALWSELMGGGGFGTRTLWLLFLDEDHRPIKVIVPIEDIPLEPDPATLDAIARILDDVLADTGPASVPMLLSRPGPLAMTDVDRTWALAIRERLARHLGQWPVHLATRNRIQVFAPDDLIAVGR